MKSLAKNSFYNILYQFLGLIFPLLSSMYVARIILEDGVGKVAYAQNIVSYFTTIALVGIPTYGIREIAKVKENDKETTIVFFELLLINAFTTTISSILYVLYLIYSHSAQNERQLFLAAGVVLWLNYANIDWFYQGKEEYGYITLRSLIIKTLSFICLPIFVKQKSDYVIYAFISSCGSACNYILNLVHAKKYIKFNIELNSLNLSRHFKPLIVMAGIVFLGNLYNKVDITMLGVMSNDAAVGLYSNAHKIILIAVSCCIAVTTVFMPRLSYYYDNDRIALERLVNYGIKILSVIVIPATAGLALLAQSIIVLLYGYSFQPAGMTLAIFAPMLLIRPIGDLLCYQLIISAGKENKRIFWSFIATIANILFNYFLIPRWQQNGAAIASILAEIIVNGFLLLEVVKIIRITVDKIILKKTFISTGIMIVMVIFFRDICHDLLIKVILSVLLGGVTYIVANFVLKNEVVISAFVRLKLLFFRRYED